MSSRYNAAMEQIRADLAAAYPDRVVSRSYLDFAKQPADRIKRGIYTLLSCGVEGYDYETSDHFGGLDGPNQTELGQFVFVITGQIKLPEKAEGEEIEAAEFELVSELETFADRGIEDERLKDLLLRRTVMSQQLDAPYAWVFTEWRLRLFD